MLNSTSINISNYMSLNAVTNEKNFNPVADYAKMASRLNRNKAICGVLEDDFRLPDEESSAKESDIILVFARKSLWTLQMWKL